MTQHIHTGLDPDEQAFLKYYVRDRNHKARETFVYGECSHCGEEQEFDAMSRMRCSECGVKFEKRVRHVYRGGP